MSVTENAVRCRYCGMLIRFVTADSTGKRIPVWPEEVHVKKAKHSPYTFILKNGKLIKGFEVPQRGPDTYAAYKPHKMGCALWGGR